MHRNSRFVMFQICSEQFDPALLNLDVQLLAAFTNSEVQLFSLRVRLRRQSVFNFSNLFSAVLRSPLHVSAAFLLDFRRPALRSLQVLSASVFVLRSSIWWLKSSQEGPSLSGHSFSGHFFFDFLITTVGLQSTGSHGMGSHGTGWHGVGSHETGSHGTGSHGTG